MQARGRRYLDILTGLISFALLFLWVIQRLGADQVWWATVLAYVPQHLYVVPTLVLLLWALWKRSWRSLLLNSLCFLFWLFILMGFVINLPMAQTDKTLRLMTFNVRKDGVNANQVAALVNQHQLDIIAFQEVKNQNWVDEVISLLPGWYAAYEKETATFSRFPIVDQQSYLVAGLDRVFLETELDTPLGKLTVFNVHLGTVLITYGPERMTQTTARRWEQLKMLLDVIETQSNPVILLGDFNTTPLSALYRELNNHLENAFAHSGFGFGYTFRSDLPVIRIDHIWLSRELTSQKSYVLPLLASDHRPLFAELRVTLQ
jgi:vancomycin resistance protein VanJ